MCQIVLHNSISLSSDSLSGVMTPYGGLHNPYYTHCHYIRTYDMVQEDVSSRASLMIKLYHSSPSYFGVMGPFQFLDLHSVTRLGLIQRIGARRGGPTSPDTSPVYIGL